MPRFLDALLKKTASPAENIPVSGDPFSTLLRLPVEHLSLPAQSI